MVDAAEVVANVGVQHVVAAARAAHAQGFQCLRRAPLRPKPIRRGAEVRLEDGLQHERRRHLRHSVSDRRNAERPLSAIGLRDVAPQNRLRTIRACAQCGAELLQAGARRHTARRTQRHRIDPRRAAVPSSPAAMPPGGRHPSRSDPSGHGSVAPGIAWPRPRVGVAIGALCRRAGAHRGNWNRSCRSCPRACLLDQRDHRRDPSLLSRCSSRGSSLLRSPRTPAAHDARFRHRLIRVALPRRRAAQTGLSCSVPLPARVLRPLPRRDLARVHLRTGARETWPSPRHDRLGSRVVNLSRLQASLDVAARVLAPSVEAFDTPLGPPASRPMPGVCYSALRRLPRRDLHPLETNSVKRAMSCPLRHDAPLPAL